MRSFRSKPVGWRNEPHRHYLAAKGISTKRYQANKYYAYTPTYVASDLPAIGADAVGTVGAETVSWIPVVVPLALAYGGAKLVKKRAERRKKEGKSFFSEKDDLQRKKLVEAADSEGLEGDERSLFYQFMKERFPEELNSTYLEEWASRFKRGPWDHGDTKTQKVLKEVMPERYEKFKPGESSEIRERSTAEKYGWKESPEFSSYEAAVEYAEAKGDYRGYNHYGWEPKKGWIAFYEKEKGE